jgi:hypothetical protein
MSHAPHASTEVMKVAVSRLTLAASSVYVKGTILPANLASEVNDEI